ncbi:MAG: Imidazole glycerol phosphate synthase subunit HisH 1 [Candidatus Heimdallarchaeota archaeon LC_3]|nr:MAG: Imidazole glycerol phosphate synthase subunit HisH 1 [Candidatus Heimdallarchaeota archaeon LC_3]
MDIVAIVDYDMSNIDSVVRAIQECGGDPIVTKKKEDFKKANRIILPGVGAFPDAMKNLRRGNLHEILREQVFDNKIPFLGICLGMQLLATTGWEGGKTEGLGWIEGDVKIFSSTEDDTRIPHIGWNNVETHKNHQLFNNIPSGKNFYFVHSYYFEAKNKNEVIGNTPYCGNFASAVAKDNIFGVQFHPEKSQKIGFQLLKNFLSI